MAVVRMGQPHHYMGNDGDVRPTTDVPAGSKYFVKDLGFWEIYDGSAWTPEISQVNNESADGVDKVAFVNATASGNTQVVAAVVGKKIRVIGDKIINSGASVIAVKYQSSTTDITPTDDAAENGGGWTNTPARGFLFETAVNEALNINLGAGGTVGGHVQYVEVD